MHYIFFLTVFLQYSWIADGAKAGGGSRVAAGGARSDNAVSGSGSRGGTGSVARSRFGLARAAGIKARPRPVGRPVSRWGKAGPSGDAARRSAPGPLDGVSRLSYAVAGTSAVRSVVGRPSVNLPVVTQGTRVQARYAPVTDGRAGQSRGYLLAGAGGIAGGYLLGSLLVDGARRTSNYSEEISKHYSTYLPFRYRQLNEVSVKDSAGVSSSSPVSNVVMRPEFEGNLCTLARWNMELPFTEVRGSCNPAVTWNIRVFSVAAS